MSRVRLAATVILARPSFEVYLARRSTTSAFAPNAFVFPGGTIEPADASPAAQQRTLGLEPERVAREFRAEIASDLHSSEPPVAPDAARALLVAALRELFEEAGVLLARTAAMQPIAVDATEWERIGAERVRVRGGELAFADLLGAHDWYADARELTLFSHWITPRSEPRRYNTHFFFAAAPPEQAALADAFEMHDGIWIAPRDALARHRRGEMHLVYPTIKHLERLSAFDSLEAALRFARSKPIVTIMPNEAADDFAIPPRLEGAW
ncbi:MAG TPA: NUDIX hydrolase [Candidatus Binatia bacterium]|nr:NUDIX hydrolase [Candidatus Binatia bacterium]